MGMIIFLTILINILVIGPIAFYVTYFRKIKKAPREITREELNRLIKEQKEQDEREKIEILLPSRPPRTTMTSKS